MQESEPGDQLRILAKDVIDCFRCPRLVTYRERIGVDKRRAYQAHTYWSRPVPGFGDPAARLLLLGLAPGAHGSNRTGRMFTGDKSGEFLYRALWETGFANQSESKDLQDGLVLTDAYISASVRCAPPDNKPTREEILSCRPYLVRELEILTRVQVVMVLGGIALDAYLCTLQDTGVIASRSRFKFAHGAVFETAPNLPTILASYHPSQQNTSTKRLTGEMLRDVLFKARALLTEPQRLNAVQTDGGPRR